MPINYREEGKYDGERGWPATPPTVAGLGSWTEYTEGYEEGRKKPLPGVKKQYTQKELQIYNDRVKKIKLMLYSIILLLVFFFMRMKRML